MWNPIRAYRNKRLRAARVAVDERKEIFRKMSYRQLMEEGFILRVATATSFFRNDNRVLDYRALIEVLEERYPQGNVE